jgi:uncharacterized LabA/DUF88 family protein
MENITIILDAHYVRILIKELTGLGISAVKIKNICNSNILPNEKIVSIYYYDCNPYGKIQNLPISLKPFNFADTDVFRTSTKKLDEIKKDGDIKTRFGTLEFRGWKIRNDKLLELRNHCRQLQDEDFEPNFVQKRTDIMIGVDLVRLAEKPYIDGILIFTKDSDFVPAIESARQKKKKIILVTRTVSGVKRILLKACSDHRIAKMLP